MYRSGTWYLILIQVTDYVLLWYMLRIVGKCGMILAGVTKIVRQCTKHRHYKAIG
jgi:hypothetical protein